MTRKTEKTRDRCIPYFQGLFGKNKDGFPLEKIIDNDVRLVAQAITLFVELSHVERGRQIHARFFLDIVKHLEGEGENDWVTPMVDELFKGFRSAKAFIAYGPQLTRMVRFSLANPTIYLGDNAQRIDPNLDQEKPITPPNLDEPHLEVPNIDENDIRALELNFSATTQGSRNRGGADQGAGEGTSRPGRSGGTIPMVTKGVERGEGEQ